MAVSGWAALGRGHTLWRTGSEVLLLSLLLASPTARASATPQESAPVSLQPSGSLGLGVSFVDVQGSRARYRSDFNSLSGWTLTDLDLDLFPPGTEGSWIDFFHLEGSGFGDAWPYERARLSFGKRGSWEFRGRFWKQEYFFSLPTFAEGAHAEDSARRNTDLALTIFPSRRLALEFAYSIQDHFGSRFTSRDVYQDLFQLSQPRRSRTQDFRLGALYRGHNFRLHLTQSFRKFKEDPEEVKTAPLGESRPASLEASAPVRVSIPSTRVRFHLFPSRRWSLQGQYSFSDGHAESTRSSLFSLDLARGLTLEELARFTTSSDRPEHRARLGWSWHITDRFVLTHRFDLRQFDIDGTLLQALRVGGGSGGAPLVSETRVVQSLDYRLICNQPLLTFTLRPGLSLYAGYRYQDRRVDSPSAGRQVTVSHNALAGLTWRPFRASRLSLGFEKGTANDAFTPTEPRQSTRWRLTSRFSLPGGWSLAPHFVFADLSNNSSGRYDSNERQSGLDLDYTAPEGGLHWSAGYWLIDFKSRGDIHFFQSDTLSRDVSLYRTHLHFFQTELDLPLARRVRLHFGYRLLEDPRGSSYPLHRDQGEAGLILQLRRGLQWEARWAHVSYNEDFSDLEDYVANRLSLALRWGF